MKTANKGLYVFALVCASCATGQHAKKEESSAGSYINKQLKIIEQHKAVLAELGRMPSDFWNPELFLAQYGWHSAPGLWFGAYSFHQPAFEQAKRSWFIHGVMEKGGNRLYAMNVNAKFDESIVGYTVVFLHMGIRNAKVIGLYKYDDGSVDHRSVLINQTAAEFGFQYNIAILPPDYVDYCQCTF
jgi:hypothetical protein